MTDLSILIGDPYEEGASQLRDTFGPLGIRNLIEVSRSREVLARVLTRRMRSRCAELPLFLLLQEEFPELNATLNWLKAQEFLKLVLVIVLSHGGEKRTNGQPREQIYVFDETGTRSPMSTSNQSRFDEERSERLWRLLKRQALFEIPLKTAWPTFMLEA